MLFQCFCVAVARRGLNRIRLQLAIYFCLPLGQFDAEFLPDVNAIGAKVRRKISENIICHIKSVRLHLEKQISYAFRGRA